MQCMQATLCRQASLLATSKTRCIPTSCPSALCLQGSGESRQLGTGSNASSAVPAEVAGNHTFVAIAAGQAHACALTPEGQAWCCESWGMA